ncbi:MAG: tetratricopeptide repeat protein [Acidobacteriota bacterium]
MLLINRRVWIATFVLLSLLVMFVSMATTKADQSPSPVQEKVYSSTEPVVLEQGNPIERELTGGEAHSYEIKLTAGQFLYVVVEQKGIDVVAVLCGPNGKQLMEVDSPNGTRGPEPILFITEVTGDYRVEVRSLEKAATAGRYDIKITELRTTIPQDKDRIAAHRAFAEGQLLRTSENAETSLKAIEKYKQALSFFRAIEDHSGEALTLIGIGSIYDSLGEKQKALDFYNEALPIIKAVGDRYEEAATLNNIGAVYDSQGNKQKALDFYNEALPIIRAIGDRRGEAATLNNIGFAYDSLGEKRKALDYYNQALSIIRVVGDRYAEIITLNNIGGVYNSQGEKQKALDYYNEALPIIKITKDRRGEAVTLNNIGLVYDSQGEKQKALDCYIQALTIMKTIGDRHQEAITLNNIGGIYHSLGEKQKALDYCNQALPIIRAVGDRRQEATTLNNLGLVYHSLGERQKALDCCIQALSIIRVVGDRRQEAIMLNDLGLVYHSLGERQKALDHYHQALPIIRIVDDRRQEATTLNNLGLVYHSLGERQKALDHYHQALPIIKAVGDRRGEATVVYNLARVEHDQGNLVEAQNKIEYAIRLIESIRTNIINQKLRSSYFASVQEQYEFYIALLMQLHQQDASAGYEILALEASERARARGLIELLTESRADIHQGVEAQLVEKEKNVQQRLTDKTEILVRLRNRKGKEIEISALEKEVDQLITEFQQIQAEIRQKSPRYAALTQPQPLSLKEIQQQVLDQDTLLLEYALGKENSYLWAVTTTSISSYKLPKRDEIEALAKTVYQLVSSYENALTNAETTYLEAATKLSQIIFGPVAKQLGKKRLLIVSDGVLQYTPFVALPLPTNTSAKNGKRSASTPAWLGFNNEIISEPSASTVAVLRRELAGRLSATKTVAVLADPVFSPDDERVKRLPEKAAYSNTQSTEPVTESIKELNLTRSLLDVDGRGTLARLPFSRDEAKAIRSLVNAGEYKEALDFDADLATATSAELGQYRYVHFASHGLIDSKHPELSGIVLSLVDEQGKTRNGMLQLADIYNLKLSADLVVLSACRTGLGTEIKGEGLVGLTRGFMYAGSARVMASLWDIEDRATAKLIGHFYHGLLKEKLRPAAALQKAQRIMWRSSAYRSPYYWAGMQLSGEWR